MIIAIIPAAGEGSRMKKDQKQSPKQYSQIGQFGVLKESIKAFLDHPEVDDIIVAIRPQDEELYKEATRGMGILPPVIGGKTRRESVYNALQSLRQINPTKVLIHDAVRPFIPKSVVSSVIQGLLTHKVVIPCIPMEDTIKKINGNKTQTVDRSELWRAQTPQGFWYQDILNTCEKYANIPFTDDSAMMEESGYEVLTVMGSKENFKITDPEDYDLLRTKVKAREVEEREKEIFVSATGIDIHAFEHNEENIGKPLVIGGIQTEGSIRVKAHSDGDVVLHAMVDAMLGTIGGGDIGQHFPDTNPKFANKNSRHFVQHALSMISQSGGRIIIVDITVLCEHPKISSIRTAIRHNIATMLNIPPSRVNIKGKTSEKMGFIGRKEGIAAIVNVTVARRDE